MSIPTSFNPLGVLGGRQPFPMVRLTSNTTGSTVDGGPLPEGFKVDAYSEISPYYPWHAFDGDTSTQAARIYRTTHYIEIDFGRAVELVKLRIYGYYLYGQNKFDIYYENEGEWVKSGFVYEISEKDVKRWDEVVISGLSARKWRIVPIANGGNQSYFYEIEYEAFYA